MPQLIVFAGPNGSGKSTFISQLAAGTRELEFTLPQRVINPDEFARAINPLAPDTVEQNRSVSSPAVLRRYARSLSRIAEAVTLTDLAFIYDNSGADFVEILRFRNGREIWRAPQIPSWAGRAFACSCHLGEEPV